MIQAVTTANQIDRVAALASAAWHEAYAVILTPAQITYMIDRFQSVAAITAQIEGEGYQYFLITTDRGQEAGFCGVHIEEGGRMYLSKMYLLAAFYGQGLFGAMLDHLCRLCALRGVHTIWLTVNRNNARAIAAYQKNGFCTVRTQVTPIGEGFVMDDYVMEKEL